MVVHILYSGKVVSVRAVDDNMSLRDAKLVALRAAVAANEVTASQALQVTFEISNAQRDEVQTHLVR